MKSYKEFIGGAILGSLLLFSTWMAIKKVGQIKLPQKMQTVALFIILGLKVPLYLWIIFQSASFSPLFWVGWGITYLLLFSYILLRSLIQVQINKK